MGEAGRNAAVNFVSTDLDFYRSAKLVVDRYSDAATLYAARRAIELNERGDVQGAAVWVRIRAAAIELMKKGAAEGETTH